MDFLKNKFFKSREQESKDAEDKAKNAKDMLAFENEFIGACKEVIKKGFHTKDASQFVDSINKNLGAENNEQKKFFDSVINFFKPNDFLNNAFADSEVVNKLGQFIQSHVSTNIKGPKSLTKFLDNDVIKRISTSYYSKYKKYFKAGLKTICNNLKKCKVSKGIVPGKLGSDIRKKLYDEKTLESWLTILGPAYSEQSKNNAKIKKVLSNKLVEINRKFQKFDFWDGVHKDIETEKLKKMFEGKNSLYEYIKDELKIDIEVLPLVLFNKVDHKLRDGLLVILNKFSKSFDEEDEIKIKNILIKESEYENVSVKKLAIILSNKLKKVTTFNVEKLKDENKLEKEEAEENEEEINENEEENDNKE